ncbi:class I SAM-dependent methyltransferase [Paracoccus caeni]|uniref:Class I SAM-dependent methyltransferase n=1 Tax=Paracoccus caeni TaxID=657651 RepID=A0A934VZN8_9RHOB|nr:class I SAM-dependent methyltransferase [Paracoccus caeni]MBK4216030.1 class I SAM-dependent methyltransferase [Paracoccus caeni]
MDWNEVFSGSNYRYGTSPAGFVAANMTPETPGQRLLTVAEGEGRNAVWLAAQGWRVTAVEGSPNAVAKGRRLAEGQGVQIDWIIADLDDFDWPTGHFDAVLGCFIQFAEPTFRDRIFAGLAAALKPGGTLYLHGFSTRQREQGYTSGGPSAVDQLYTLPILRRAFPDWPKTLARDYDDALSSGEGHQGAAALIDFIARKPS